jgi:hypothetical protein
MSVQVGQLLFDRCFRSFGRQQRSGADGGLDLGDVSVATLAPREMPVDTLGLSWAQDSLEKVRHQLDQLLTRHIVHELESFTGCGHAGAIRVK